MFQGQIFEEVHDLIQLLIPAFGNFFIQNRLVGSQFRVITLCSPFPKSLQVWIKGSGHFVWLRAGFSRHKNRLIVVVEKVADTLKAKDTFGKHWWVVTK
jgi:hypothetical protein